MTAWFLKESGPALLMLLQQQEELRSRLFAHMNAYFDELDGRLDLPWWTEELTERFRDFTTRGKAMRGCLLLSATRLLSGTDEIPAAALDAAAALEITHAGLLIHDDIMDRDELRRGRKALHIRLSEGRDPHVGSSLATCIGDCAFFCSYDLLARLDIDQQTHRAVLSTYSLALTQLGLAQMQDIALAADRRVPEPAALERMLIEKSGRYSFSLPLVLAALITGVPERTAFLEGFGARLGLIFQIRDDELALFGDPDETGKPVLNDVREGKKTLFWSALMERVSDGDAPLADEIFGNANASDDQLESIRRLFERYAIRDAMHERMDTIAKELGAQLEDLDERERDFFEGLIAWNLERSR